MLDWIHAGWLGPSPTVVSYSRTQTPLMRRVLWRSNSGAAVDFLTRSFSLFFLFGIFLFFFFAREILRPKDEVYVQSVAGRGLAHIYFLRHPTTSFFPTLPVRQTNKQKERKKGRWFSFFFFCFLSHPPFLFFFLVNERKKKKKEGRTTFERRALEVWNLISEISVFKSFFISRRTISQKFYPIQFEVI